MAVTARLAPFIDRGCLTETLSALVRLPSVTGAVALPMVRVPLAEHARALGAGSRSSNSEDTQCQ